MNTDVAVLFARRDSVYKSLAGCDVWDIDRDAMTWTGGAPVVAHPPCRAWGRLRAFAKPREFARSTGPFAIDQVRAWGGVVEHPSHSSLWLYCGLPAPGHVDRFGGWTLPISQSWFGHRAEKATWLYIVGLTMADMPSMPIALGAASHVVNSSADLRKGMTGWRPEIRKDEREATPPQLAQWLVDLARLAAAGGCDVPAV